MISNVHKCLRIVAISLLVILILFHLVGLCGGHDHEHHHHDHDHGHGHSAENPSFKYSEEANIRHQHGHSSSNVPRSKKSMSVQTLWLEALSATLIISIAPFLILFFVPLDHRQGNEGVLKILLSFASGGLLGDAFLHLIPHALHPHSHGSHDHDSNHVHTHHHGSDDTGSLVLGGILIFLILDKLMRWLKVGHNHDHSNKKSDDDHDDESEHINEIAFLNLIADFVHNLTDGLAIGASFLAGEAVGLVTTVTILLHEVPHEIGDFAILIQSGCSKKKAMLWQLVTAVGAFVGTVLALWFRGIDSNNTTWALPFTAGGFIYIATVSIIPDLLKDSTFWQSVKEVLALIFGVLLMVLVAQFE